MENNTKVVIFFILATPFGYKASQLITNVPGEWYAVISSTFLMISCYYFGKHISEMDASLVTDEGGQDGLD